jgi:hypothetical protein
MGYIASMFARQSWLRRSRLWVLWLAIAVPLQGLVATAWPPAAQAAPAVETDAAAVADGAEPPCHGHHDAAAVDEAAPTEGDGQAGCGCCAACGLAALPAAAPPLAGTAPATRAGAGPPAGAPVFVTGGPERPPRA